MPKRNYLKNANVKADMPDNRDWMYQPALIQLEESVDLPTSLKILDQKSEGACTGFAVAAAINHLYTFAQQKTRVSPRMLYEMAKRHDEWPGETYDGSSLRGAINGWKNMGVCEEEKWPYEEGKPRDLTIKAAKDACKHSIGAYYRLHPIISDFHAAINEVGVIVASAKTHSGWSSPKNGVIKFIDKKEGGHAFAIVGYNSKGFWVQNSWGQSWGNKGIALWSYEDWVKNVMDAWVFQLALSTPQIFGMLPASSRLLTNTEAGKTRRRSVPRSKIAGHFVHIDDGHYKTKGRYWSNQNDVEQTAKLLAGSKEYQHLLFYFHGGLNSPLDSATRIAAMKEIFKANGIYPYHIMYDTGIVEELKDLIFRKENSAEDRVGGFSDMTDRFIEGLLRRPGALLWNEMKQDAEDAFTAKGAGTDTVKHFHKQLGKSNSKVKLHLVGHSTGGVVIGHLLKRLNTKTIKFSTCSLMAPACTLDHYYKHYYPVLQKKTKIKIDDFSIYNLKDELENDDHVAKVYRKSLLYLVSNAFEEEKSEPLLGMEKFRKQVKLSHNQPKFIYSNGIERKQSHSKTHGGFDNDIYTMNHIMTRVLGKKPKRPFLEADLKY